MAEHPLGRALAVVAALTQGSESPPAVPASEKDCAGHRELARRLDVLAHHVAGALERGDTGEALAATVALECAVGAGWPADDATPPAPVIGRRFARAHRLTLQRADRAGGGHRGGGELADHGASAIARDRAAAHPDHQ